MKIVFMKRIVYVMLALIFMLMPSLVKAQGDLAAFDLKGKVKQCTWVNHKAVVFIKAFRKMPIKKCCFLLRPVVV